MTFLVIVNADDFGLTTGVNSSVISCHVSGSLTSATLLPNMDGTEEAARLAVAHPTLGVGLHFNITQGRPLSRPAEVSSLLSESGEFLDRSRLLVRALTGRIRPDHVRTELLAQHAHLRSFGVNLTHIDSHQHAHAIPSVFRVVATHACDLGLALRVPKRWIGTVEGKSVRRIVREVALQKLIKRCLAGAPEGLRTNDGLCSIFDLDVDPSRLDIADYARLLEPYTSGVVELMVHPGMGAELSTRTAISAVSAVEDRLLRSNVLREHVASRGGRLVTYRDVR